MFTWHFLSRIFPLQVKKIQSPKNDDQAPALGALESPFNDNKSSRYRVGPLPAALFSEISTYLEIRSHAVPPDGASRLSRNSASSFLISLDVKNKASTSSVRLIFPFDCCNSRKSRR